MTKNKSDLQKKKSITSNIDLVIQTINANRKDLQSQPLKLAMLLLPLIIIPEMVWAYTTNDVMLLSGLISVQSAFIIFQFLLQRVPDIFETLWNRNIIMVQLQQSNKDPDSAEEPTDEEIRKITAIKYSHFIIAFERCLNHPAQWALGILFAITAFSRFFYKWHIFGYSVNFIDILTNKPGGWLSPNPFLIEPTIGLFVGLVIWRLLIIGFWLRRIGKEFDLIPQLGHIDGCGGLRPIGDICLLNALILSIPSLFLGFWIVTAPSFKSTAGEYGYLVNFFSILLLPVIFLVFVSFFFPLWRIHKVMHTKGSEVKKQMDKIANSINDNTRYLLENVNELEEFEGEKISKKLNFMKQIYEQNHKIATWPFNLRIMINLFGSQVIPVLALVKRIVEIMMKQ